MNKDNMIFPEDQLDEILKSSVRMDPPAGIEENVMKKISSTATEKSVSWVFIMISALFVVVFFSIILFPVDLGITSQIGNGFSLNSLNLFNADSFSFLYEKPYLIMSMVVFTAALWMLVSFNLPKEKSTDFNKMYCL